MAIKTDCLFSETKFTNFLWVLSSTLLAIILFLSLNRNFNFDEIETVHTAWKILQGEKIYIDFFQHHHPLLYYLVIPVILVAGEHITTLIIARLLIFFLLILIFITTYQLAIKFFSKEIAVTSLIFLATTVIFVDKAIELRPDVPQTLFNLIALLWLFTYFENRDIKYLVLSSFASGIAFLFLQKALLFIFLVLCLLVFNIYKKSISYRSLLIYLLVLSLSFLPYLIHLVYTGSINSYFIFNWVLNIKFLDRSYPFDTLIETYKTNTLLWFFYILSLSFFIKTSIQKQFSFISLGLLVFIFLTRKTYNQYYIPLIPLVVVIASYSVHFIFNSKKAITLVLVLSILIPSYNFYRWTSEHKNDWQVQKINYVLSITSPKDFVYDGNVSFNLFRRDIDFFWYSLDQGDGLSTYKTIADYNYNIYELIDKYKPKVISNSFIENIEDDRIAKHYRQSSLYEDLFIRIDSE